MNDWYGCVYDWIRFAVSGNLGGNFMLKITMKDGSVREVNEGTSILDFVKQVKDHSKKKKHS